MFLFILESIGTSELILIAVVALIVFGPRKLPQMAKTIGKTMSEFRNATNQFKSTWEKEVAFEDEGKDAVRAASLPENSAAVEHSIAEDSTQTQTINHFPAPEVREITFEELPESFQIKEPLANVVQSEENKEEHKVEKSSADKRDWL